MKQHKIHSTRFGANQKIVNVYTSCGRVQITVDDGGVKVHMRPHKTKTLMNAEGWPNVPHDTVYFRAKPKYKSVRTTRQGGIK